jgi:hypothetical protein
MWKVMDITVEYMKLKSPELMTVREVNGKVFVVGGVVKLAGTFQERKNIS